MMPCKDSEELSGKGRQEMDNLGECSGKPGRHGSWTASAGGGSDSDEQGFTANDESEQGDFECSDAVEELHVVTTSRSRGVASDKEFIQGTYRMVEDCSLSHPQIISWNKEGNGIEVKDVAGLEGTILRRYFNHGNYSSFVRQLNKYNFKRSKTKPARRLDGFVQSDIFEHRNECFQRGRPDLLVKITRKKQKQGTAAGKFNCEDEVEPLKTQLVSLRDTQTDIQRSMKSLEEISNEQKAHIARLRQEDISKDHDIKALELRMSRMEGCLYASFSGQHHNPFLFSQTRQSWTAGSPVSPFASSFRQPSFPGLFGRPSTLTFPPPRPMVSTTVGTTAAATSQERQEQPDLDRHIKMKNEAVDTVAAGLPNDRQAVSRNSTFDSCTWIMEGILDVMQEDDSHDDHDV